MTPRAANFIAVVAVAACSRRSPTPRPANETNGTQPLASHASSGGPVSAASLPRDASADGSPELAAVRSLFVRWNQAMNAHDPEALSRIYGRKMCFYGKEMSREQVLEAKRRAFRGTPDYLQEVVGEVALEPLPADSVAATFEKRSGTHDRSGTVKARLLFIHPGTELGRRHDLVPWVLAGENDETVRGKNLMGCENAALWSGDNEAEEDQRCEEVASKAVREFPAVKALLESELEEIKGKPGLWLGGFGPEPHGDGGFAVVIGIQSKDRVEGVASYNVDRKSGALSVAIGAEDVVLPEETLRAVRAACKE
jgi:hypothetical protein